MRYARDDTNYWWLILNAGQHIKHLGPFFSSCDRPVTRHEEGIKMLMRLVRLADEVQVPTWTALFTSWWLQIRKPMGLNVMITLITNTKNRIRPCPRAILPEMATM